MLSRGSLLAVVLVVAWASIFPTPKHAIYHPGSLSLQSPCLLFPRLQSSSHPLRYYLDKIIHRANGGTPCPQELLYRPSKHTLLTAMEDQGLPNEGYRIQVNEDGIQLEYSDYSGYIYALESLSQFIDNGEIPFCLIEDQPLVEHRGIMIDSSRHFLSVKIITKLLNSMSLVKLNVLHWHLANDQSFPVSLGSHPQLAQHASYGKKFTYSLQEIRQLIKVGQLNGVTIIPEVESPSHVRSWGQAPEWKNGNITIKCDGGMGYTHQLDVSKPQVYQLAKDVLHEVGALFKSSPYVHLGGRDVSEDCWKKRPAITTFMKLRNIHNFKELQNFWRYELKQALSMGKKAIFWVSDSDGTSFGKQDVAQYWGNQNQTAQKLGGSNNKVILSPSDLLLLNSGQGDVWQKESYGTYSVWKDIINNFTVHPEGIDKNRILGAEVVLEGYLVNEDIFENDLWPRTAAFAYRAWTDHKLEVHEAAEGLVKIKEKLSAMGVEVSPITSQFCEGKPAICWPVSEETEEKLSMAEK